MPCLILTGHPSCGKTTLAHMLRERALVHEAIDEVLIINEESDCGCDGSCTKQQCYETSVAEKQTRGTLKAAFDRAVCSTTLTRQQRKRRLIILDSLNYIKGFRYELHCISKSAGEIHGVLWILNRLAVVHEWNNKAIEEVNTGKSKGGGYTTNLLNELVSRYEPPDERNRWDRPLFLVDIADSLKDQTANNISKPKTEAGFMPSDSHQNTLIQDSFTESNSNIDTKTEVLEQSVYNMHSLGHALGTTTTTTTTSSETSNLSATTADRITTKTAQNQSQEQQTKPTKSAFKKTTKKSAFQRKPVQNKGNIIQNLDDLKKEAIQDDNRLSSFYTDPIARSNILSQEKHTQKEITHTDPAGITPSRSPNTLPDNSRLTLEEQLDHILDVFLLQTKALKEGMSTQQNVAGEANVLQDLNSISAQLISSVATAYASQNVISSSNPLLILQVPFLETGKLTSLSIQCHRPVTLPELRRLRKRYLQWAANHLPEDTSAVGIANSFLSYIEDQL